MKIDIISDIHGNIDALNCVLKMLEKESVFIVRYLPPSLIFS